MSNDSRQFAPATQRNREPILAILREELPVRGLVLEVASGTGEHAVHFVHALPHLQWQPSDPSSEALASIAAWRDGTVKQVDSDVTYVRQTVFEVDDFDISDVGALFTTAASISERPRSGWSRQTQ